MVVHRIWLLCVTVVVMFVFPGCAAADPLPINPDPVGFPDIAGYTAVDLADYQIIFDQPGSLLPRKYPYFMTPDGLVCHTLSGGSFVCAGRNLPGMPTRLRDVEASMAAGEGPEQRAGTGLDGMIRGQRIRMLPPFHSLTAGGSTCAVDNAGATACKDAAGAVMILTPKGTRSLRAGDKTWTYFLK